MQEWDSLPDIDDDSNSDSINSVLNDSLSQELESNKILEVSKNSKKEDEQEPESKLDNHFENILGKGFSSVIFALLSKTNSEYQKP